MPEDEDPEVERFKQQVREEASRLIEDYPGKQADLDAAVDLAFKWISRGELAALLQTQNRLCVRCGECCMRCSRIALTNDDVGRVSRFFDWDRLTFITRFNLKPSPYQPNTWLMPAGPCPFLEEGNRCSIYSVRPEACREFPAGFLVYGVAGGTLEIPTYCAIVKRFFIALVLRRLRRR